MCDETKAARRAAAMLPFALILPVALHAGGAVAQQDLAAAEPADAVEEIVVLGAGQSRQVQAVTAAELAQLPAGTSPLKAIEKLPGVNFQAADPFGNYEWSTRITVRGFNQNRLGFTLDDVPLGDMTYGNHNGLHISRAIASELIDRVVLSQGAGALDTASTSNLGGTVEFFSADPSAQFGAKLQQTLGSDSTRRTFARLDSGDFGTGTRAYLSVVDGSTEKWKGAGDQKQKDITFKLTQSLGAALLKAYYNYSDRAETDYQDLSKDIVARRGWDWDNWYPDWNAAVAAADACNASGQSDAVACDDAYWNASGLRKDDLGYLSLELPLGEALRWKTTVYAHRNEGQGLWGTPYVPTPGGAPLSIRTTEYDLDRQGLISALSWTLQHHEIEGGIWYEGNDFTQARRFYGEPSRTAPSRSFYKFQRDPLQTQWEYDFETTTVVLHLQDTWALSEALRINVGLRSVQAENKAKTVVGDPKNGSIDADTPLLPQLGVNWKLSEQQELFGSVTRNVRTFASSGTSGPFSTTAAGFAAIRDDLDPETAINYEAGLRFRGTGYDGLIAIYHVDFRDRLLGITTGPGVVGNPAVLSNVGGVSSNGVETALTWRPLRNIRWFVSAAYNDSQFDDDYSTVDGNGERTVVPVSGKQVPDTPKLLLKSDLGYDDGAFFAHLDINYTGKRYYTYLNEGEVDAYTLLNAGLGYRLGGLGPLQLLSLQLDATNLGDKKYYSTIDSNGFVNSDPNGTAQTLLRGAPRQFFVALKADF